MMARRPAQPLILASTPPAQQSTEQLARQPADSGTNQGRWIGPLWPVTAEAFARARADAVPFTGQDTSHRQRVWAARVDAAVAGIDQLDPVDLDRWFEAHATARIPHLHEATLVAVWESNRDEVGAGSAVLDPDVVDLRDRGPRLPAWLARRQTHITLPGPDVGSVPDEGPA